jgi:hypothetical protein
MKKRRFSSVDQIRSEEREKIGKEGKKKRKDKENLHHADYGTAKNVCEFKRQEIPRPKKG